MTTATMAKSETALEVGLSVLRNREDVERQLAQRREEYSAATNEANRLEIERRAASEMHGEAYAALKAAEKRNDDEESLRPLRAKASAALAKHDELRDAKAKAEARRDELNAELSRLQLEVLPASKGGAPVEAVLGQQENVAAAEKAVAEIQAAIAVARDVITNARAAIPALTVGDADRQALLGSIALGRASKNELEELDRTIAAERAAHDKATRAAAAAISDAEGTIANLEGRLSLAEVDLQAIRDECNLLLRSFLHSEAKAAGNEYLKHAEAVLQQLLRVRALQSVLRSEGERDASFFHLNVGRFWIPALNLPSFPSAVGGALFSADANIADDAVGKAAAIELARLRALGVKL